MIPHAHVYAFSVVFVYRGGPEVELKREILINIKFLLSSIPTLSVAVIFISERSLALDTDGKPIYKI